MTEAYTSARTDEAKKELAWLLQQQAEIEAIMNGKKTGENVLWLIRWEGNIMPEYREEQESDIAIWIEREVTARRIWKITFPPAWHFRETSEKSIQRVQEVITAQMQRANELENKKWVEKFEILHEWKSVSGEYLWVSFCITLVGWGKIKIQTQDQDFDTLEIFLKTVQKTLFEKIWFPLAQKIPLKWWAINVYALLVKFQRFINSTYSPQMWLSKRVFVFIRGVYVCFHELHLSAYLNGNLKSKDMIVIPQDDFYASMFQYLTQTEKGS
jgi:hypothetical protein